MAEVRQGSSRDLMSDDDVDLTLPPPLREQQNTADSSKLKKSKKQKNKAAASGGVHQDSQINKNSSSKSKSISNTALNHGDFRRVAATSRFPLAPVFAQDSLDGVRQCLQSWTMRYIPSIDGVLLSFDWPPEILQANAPLAPSTAYTLVHAKWKGVVFRPQIGSRTTGRLSLATPSTVSLLLHNLFNASISADQIPKDKYEWDPQARLPYSLVPLVGSFTSSTTPRKASAILPEDPSFIQQEQSDMEYDEAEETGEAAYDEADAAEEEAELGAWVHKETREPLGGTTGHIDFTVIGLTIANSMISTHGSLLSHPLGNKSSKSKTSSKKRTRDDDGKKRKRARQE